MEKKFASPFFVEQHNFLIGFTLTELLIAVSIISLIAVIAMPRFSRMVRKSKEAAAKGNLGALRSAITIYYSYNKGIWPWQNASLGPLGRLNPKPGPPASRLDLNNNVLVTEYIDAIPPCFTGQGVTWGTGTWGNREHEGGNWLEVADSSIPPGSASYPQKADHDWDAEWLYYRDTGEVWINCALTDLNKDPIYSW